MSEYQTLLVNLDSRGIAHVRLNRPEKRNALSGQMIAELTHLANAIGSSPDTRAIILAGAGDYFCAGGDLEWMRTQIDARREERIIEARKLAAMFQALNTMPAPLIGLVHGGAFGGGIGLICVCDVVVALSDTKFGLTETKLGLIPATIGPYVIARMGEGNARRVFMSGRIFDSQEASALGLLHRTCGPEELEAAAEAEAKPYLSAAPGAVGRAKALARALGPRIDEDIINDTIERLADAWESAEAREGIDAFFSKKPPRWVQSPKR